MAQGPWPLDEVEQREGIGAARLEEIDYWWQVTPSYIDRVAKWSKVGS